MEFRSGSDLTVEYTPLALHNGDAVMDSRRSSVGPCLCAGDLGRVAVRTPGRHGQASPDGIPGGIPPPVGAASAHLSRHLGARLNAVLAFFRHRRFFRLSATFLRFF